MKLLILDGPRDSRTAYNPLYRGTYRSHPSHCDELSDEHEINRLFSWFIEEGGQSGIVRDLPKALRFADLWNARLNMPERFEVVEATDADAAVSLNGTFMGFDLSAGYNNSLLAEGLRQSRYSAQLPDAIRELWGQASQYYAPQLNSAGLFQTLDIANRCLKSLIALQDLSPNLFEGGDLKNFVPIGLHEINRRLIG